MEADLTNLRKLNASNVEMNKRSSQYTKPANDTRLLELEATFKELKDQIKKLKADNIELEKAISIKQISHKDSEKKMLSIKTSMLHQEAKNNVAGPDIDKLQTEYDNLCVKKKQLLEVKNSKESEHKVLRENLGEYLKNLEHKFIGFLSNGNI